ncbi:MAG: acyl-CoA dehydrogenase [Motiliproteus sp.]
MSEYIAPLEEMLFTLNDLAGFERLAELPGFEDASPDMVAAILEQAGKQATSTVAPLNSSGDQQGVTLTSSNDVVTPAGFKEAYQHYIDSGWGALQFSPSYGGQGLPFSLAVAVQEMWHAANMAWGLCPLLSQGAVEAIASNASEALKQRFLPPMIAGSWTGTMNLTEPQAGSDLAAIRTRAVRDGEQYRIFGQKIFITWGEHDMAENIVHLVLARLPDAPPGARGISLFLVPKFIPNPDGSLGQRNDCIAISLEHKIGIHASPTCAMSYGDNNGAIGYLVGEEHQGLACMFTMMNNARLTVGLQGVAVAERAYQQANDYARERVQGTPIGGKENDAIIGHPDVKRMLDTIKSLTEAGRALAYVACTEVDLEAADLAPEHHQQHRRRVGVLTPMVKGWCTEMAQEAVSLAVQVHGGMGYVEESGIGQLYRDARILPIYEGTNGIQAMDLISRKTVSDRGLAMFELINEMTFFTHQVPASTGIPTNLVALFSDSVEALKETVNTILENADNKVLLGTVAFNYLMLSATVVGGWQMLRAATIAQQQLQQGSDRAPFYLAKLDSCRVYLGQILPRYLGLASAIKNCSIANPSTDNSAITNRITNDSSTNDSVTKNSAITDNN